MSGHSKWATIRNQKAATDSKRGAIFTKLARNITIAARDKGGDPEMNSALRSAIDKAKEFNMPKDNIEKAIKRGTGEIEGANIEEITYEAFGPDGIALIIKCITDNRNRTVANIRHILTKHGGSMGEANAVAWMFDEKGVIRISKNQLVEKNISQDEFELSVIDDGALDFENENGEIIIYTGVKDLRNVREALENKGIIIDSAILEWVAKNEIDVKGESREKIERLFETLGNDEDAQDVYSNVK
ncbi:MAG: YebC/PmpR family DNA-binding transcriptional regulator, partial [bacterium]